MLGGEPVEWLISRPDFLFARPPLTIFKAGEGLNLGLIAGTIYSPLISATQKPGNRFTYNENVINN